MGGGGAGGWGGGDGQQELQTCRTEQHRKAQRSRDVSKLLFSEENMNTELLSFSGKKDISLSEQVHSNPDEASLVFQTNLRHTNSHSTGNSITSPAFQRLTAVVFL